MNERNGPVPFQGDETNKNKDQEKLNNLKDLDEEFLAKLRLFPFEIQEAFSNVPPKLRRRLFSKQTPARENRDAQSTSDTTFFRRGTLADLEQFINEDRHANHEWIEEEIEELDAIQRELLMCETLSVILKSIDFGASIKSGPHRITEVMDGLWNTRSHPDPIPLFREDRFAESQLRLDALTAEKKQLIAELDRLGSKKRLNRPAQHRLEQLRSVLANEHGLTWHGVGSLRETLSWTDKQRQVYELKQELQKQKIELACQKTLALLCETMDASEFSVIVSEALDHTFWVLKRQQPELLKDLFTHVEAWHTQHQNERALKQPLDSNPSLEKKRQKLIEHFWRLFDSYFILKKQAHTKPSQLEGTTQQLSILLHLLK